MRRLIVCAASVLFLAACGKSDDPSADSGGDGGSGASSPKGSAGDKPWDDTSKPYLSDKKMGDFITSLKDSTGPFDTISKGKISAFNAGERMDEFDAAARKHGFQSGEEYMAAWVRINTAMTLVMQEESNQSMIRIQEESIKSSQEALKKPDLTPEMRQRFEEQIKGSQESLEALKQPRDSGFNAQDVETFKKHRAAFEEAMKNWNK